MRYRPLYTNILSLSVIFLGVFALGGCDSGPSGPGDPDDNSTLIPLEEGNTWTMQVAEGFVDQVEFYVGSTVTVNGDTYREIEITATSPGRDDFTNRYVARQEAEGLYIARPDTVDGGVQLYGFELRTSASEGDAYVHTDERGNAYDVSVSEQTITVQAGTFDVLAYRAVRQSSGAVDITYIAPSIGPIRIDWRGSTFRLVSTNVE